MRKFIVSVLVISFFFSAVVNNSDAAPIKPEKLSQSEAENLRSVEADSADAAAKIECGDSGDAALGAIAALGILGLLAAAAAS